MPPRRPEVTRLSVKDELRFQAWAHRNGITDVDHPDSHYDYRGYWRSVKGADHPRGKHFPDTFKQHGHPTFSVESKYSRGPNDGGHWMGETFIPQGAERARADALPNISPRNRAREVRQSFTYNHPELAGMAEAAGRVAKGVATFVPEALKALTSYTPEELRTPEVRQQVKDMGLDPDALLHEALRMRGAGAPVGSAEGALAIAKGLGGLGYNLQRAIQGGDALYSRDENGRFHILNTDVNPRERASAITEMGLNAALLGLGRYGELAKAARASGQPMSPVFPTFGRLARTVANERGSIPVGPSEFENTPSPENSANAPNSRTRNPRLNAEPTPTESAGFQRYKTTEYVRYMDDQLREGKGFSLEPNFAPTKRTGYAVADPNYTLDLTGVENRRTAMHEFLDRPDVKAKLASGDYVIGGWGNEINLTRLFEHRADALEAGFVGKQQAVGHLLKGVYQGDINVPKLWPSVQGADGKWYLGLNHDLAEENAANALRATPEGRAAMMKNGGNAVIRNTRGFDTLGQTEHLTREQAGTYARENNMAPNLAKQYSQLHSSDIVPEAKNIMTQAQEHPVPLAPLTPDTGDPKVSPDYVDPSQPIPGFMGTGANSMTPTDVANTRIFGVPTIIMRGSKLFDPSVGAPGIAEMTRRYGFPESGSILKYVAPGTLLRDVPQTVFDLPAPKRAGAWGLHYGNARNILNMQNAHLMDAIYRGLDLNKGGPGQIYPWWYNAEPILGSAIEHLGPELGLRRFNALADQMKPTSINTEPPRNLRNASYQLYRSAHPDFPMFPEGYSPLYPNEMVKFLRQLEAGGGRMTQPKIEPYGQAFKGDWGTSIGDMHYHRALEAFGLPYGANADPGVAWGPYNAAFTDFAHELADQGILPDVPGRSPVAPAQATMWGGMGRFTGVKGIETARPTIWQMFEDAAHRSARHLGMSPTDFLHHFWHLDTPLF